MLKKLWTVLLALLLFLLAAAPVLAHATLVRSEPSANSAQKTPPTLARLWFSEDIEPSFSTVTVVNSGGTAVDKGDVHRMADDSKGLEVSLNDLPEGLYTVVWKTTSAVDGHVAQGSFSFTVGAVPLADASPRAVMSLVDAAIAASAPPPWYQVLARWLNLVFLILFAGALFFPLIVLFPALRRDRTGESVVRNYIHYFGELVGGKQTETRADIEPYSVRWLRLTRIALVGVAVVSIALLLAQSLAEGQLAAVAQIITATRFGTIWLARAVLLIILAVLLFRPAAREMLGSGKNRTLLLSAGLGVLLLVTQSLNSHDAAVADPPVVPFFTDLIHLLGTALWIGGLVQLLVALPAILRPLDESSRVRTIADVIATFSLVAFVTVGVIVLTGAYSLLLQVGSFEAFFSTIYGTTLLVKFLLVLPLLALGAFNLIVTRTASANALGLRLRSLLVRFDIAVALEIALAAGILFAVGVMTSAVPSKSAYDPNPQAWIETKRTEDLNVTLGIAPGLVGTNDFDAMVRDANGQPITNASVVRIIGTMKEMDMGVQDIPATNQGGGHYTLHGDLMSMVGTWTLQVLVRRPGMTDVRVPFTLVAAGTRLPTNPPLIETSTQAQAGLGLALLAFAIGTASVLTIKKRQLRLGSQAGAIAVALVGAFLIYQSSATNVVATFVPPTVPEVARLAHSPVAPVPVQLAAGQKVYLDNCATCHGTDGKGDGPTAANLTPKPADLTLHVPLHTDGELYWWVTNGITTTAMPAWQNRLTDIQRWQAVEYIRTYFGSKSPPPPPPVGELFPPLTASIDPLPRKP